MWTTGAYPFLVRTQTGSVDTSCSDHLSSWRHFVIFASIKMFDEANPILTIT
jgi:hypothetical protein